MFQGPKTELINWAKLEDPIEENEIDTNSSKW